MKDKQSSSQMSDDNNPSSKDGESEPSIMNKQNTEQLKKIEEIKKDIEEILEKHKLCIWWSFKKGEKPAKSSDWDFSYSDCRIEIINKIADYITKTTPSHDEIKREVTEDIKKLLMSGKGRETGVWHYELNEANDMEASAFGDYLNIKEVAKAIAIYLTQSKEGGEDD